ncbi:MAG: sodium:solute symporter, partial [Candidatus Eremiobacterota bacterium]
MEWPRMRSVDVAGLAAYFLVLAWIGWKVRAREADSRSYLLGDRAVPWWAVLCSIIGTEISALTFVGVPALAYSGNWTYLQLALGAIGGRILVSLYFVPAYYRHNVVSIYEFILQRYGPWTRTVTVLVFLFTRVLMSGVRLYAGAVILQLALGVSAPTAVAIVAVLGLTFTVAGGIRGVIWTEVLQVTVMFVGALTAVGVLLASIPGGW